MNLIDSIGRMGRIERIDVTTTIVDSSVIDSIIESIIDSIIDSSIIDNVVSDTRAASSPHRNGDSVVVQIL